MSDTNDTGWTPPFHLIALGASAGGLDSLRTFFENLPPDGPEAAYLVLMHLAPDHDSDLVPILAEHTNLPVRSVADGDEIRAGRIHVPPPGTRLTVDAARVRVTPRSAPTERVIDGLFASVASEWRARGVGVVFSGAGDDGSRGISHLRDVGALTLAEDPSSARFDSMPMNAIRTGHVDVVERPELLAETVKRLIDDAEDPPTEIEGAEFDIDPLLSVILQKRGRDFRDYRATTIWRRIDRRRKLQGCESFQEYTDFVCERDEELDELIGDLVITVTRFFRDPEAWRAIRKSAIGGVLDRKKDGDTVRIWVPGCATGEEAYSITTLFAEEIQARALDVDIQAFATDIDLGCIQTARRGVYPLAIEEDVPPEIIDRHFELDGGHYRILKMDRQRIVFSVHDLMNDPPFAHMDFVSCRNLFIYLKPKAQRRALSYFHYSLEPEGYLVLGTSESIRGSEGLFKPVTNGAKIFQKIEGSEVPRFRFPSGFTGLDQATVRTDTERSRPTPIELSELGRRILLQQYGPAAAIVDEDRTIVYVLGDLSPFIHTPSGPVESRLMSLVRPELTSSVRRAFEKIAEDAGRFVGDPVELDLRGAPGRVRIAAHRVQRAAGPAGHVMVVFEELARSRAAGEALELDEEARSGERGLKAELMRAREELRSRDELRDAAIEELSSANEKLISMNEELQSMNEEFSMAKEELQSMNEELETINDELDHRVRELRRANSNMENLLASTQIATIFLDRNLRILNHSMPATKLFNLIESDQGRRLGDISHSLYVTDLEGSMRKVLETLEPHEEVVRAESGSIYSLRILPYRTPNDVVDGLVVTLVDITDLKAAESLAARLGAVVQVSNDPMIIVTTDGTIEVWNPGATLAYGYSADEAVGMNMSELVPEDERDDFQALLDQSAELAGPTALETRRVTKDGTELEVWTTLTVVQADGGPRIAFAERDVTERVKAARHRELLLRELDHRVKNTLATVQAIADRTLANQGSSPKDFVETFQGRLAALGRVHHELSEVKWGGMDLQRLVRRTLEPYIHDGQAALEGPPVLLAVRVSLPLAIALHELATNAAKYGALGTAGGRVDVSWTLGPAEELLTLKWRETGGPPVSEPDEHGFGMDFLTRGLAYQIGAEIECDFTGSGFSCTLDIPLDDGDPNDPMAPDGGSA